jgi:hypothetical protein
LAASWQQIGSELATNGSKLAASWQPIGSELAADWQHLEAGLRATRMELTSSRLRRTRAPAQARDGAARRFAGFCELFTMSKTWNELGVEGLYLLQYRALQVKRTPVGSSLSETAMEGAGARGENRRRAGRQT